MYRHRENDIKNISIGPSNPNILPMDTVTHTTWFDQNNFAVSSFDGYFRLYEIHLNSQNPCFNLAFEFKYNFPLIYFTFLGNSTSVAIGTCDGKVLLLDMAKSPQSNGPNFQVINEMNEPLSKLFYFQENNSLICVDTSKTVQSINLNSGSVDMQYLATEEIQDCDFAGTQLVLALANNYLEFIDPLTLRRYSNRGLLIEERTNSRRTS